MVATSWTGDARVKHRTGYVYILYVALQLLPFLYVDDAFIIHVGKAELNS